MVWFFSGLVFISLSVPLLNLEQDHFSKTETFYSVPLPPTGGHFFVRKDTYGKGTYGASRNGGRVHQGIDLLAPIGQKVFAAKSGRVVSCLEENGYGRWIEIRHPDGLKTRYAHLSTMTVKRGDWVKVGQTIGTCGKTGNAGNPRIKPHLHFEIRSEKGCLNPASGLLDPSLSLVNQ